MIRVAVVISGCGHLDGSEISETVFKETIINVFSHRDYYDKGAVINAEVFDDRVEISNPGGLVSAIPESEFGKRSHSRNPFIYGLFARMQLIFTVMLKRPVESSLKSSLKNSLKNSLKSS